MFPTAQNHLNFDGALTRWPDQSINLRLELHADSSGRAKPGDYWTGDR